MSVAEQAGLSLAWLQTPKTGFLLRRLKLIQLHDYLFSFKTSDDYFEGLENLSKTSIIKDHPEGRKRDTSDLMFPSLKVRKEQNEDLATCNFLSETRDI